MAFVVVAVDKDLEAMAQAADSKNCPECGGAKLIRDYVRGERFCDDCGVVVDENIIDQAAPYRTFSDNPNSIDRVHHGAPANPLLHDKGLQTTLGGRNEMRDARGKAIPHHMQTEIKRMRWQQLRMRVKSNERGLVEGIQKINTYVAMKGLSHDVSIGAVTIYRRAHRKYIRGRSIETVALVCIYAACRENGVPRSLDEIADGTDISRREIGRTYTAIKRALKLKILPVTAESYIARFCSDLKLSATTQAETRDVLKQYSDKGGLIYGNPIGLLSGALYISGMVCNEPRTQRVIAEKLCLTEVTVRNNYCVIRDKLGLDSNLRRNI